MIEIDTYEFHGHIFRVGDRARVMNYDEAVAQYGMSDLGHPLFPSGEFDYSDLGSDIGGIEFTIEDIDSNGKFTISDSDPNYDRLNSWIVDAEICVEANYPGFDESEDDLDPDTLSLLLGGDFDG